jgi:hypothetical protein
MKYRFTPRDESLPWFGAEARVVGPIGAPMSALVDALEDLGYTMEDLHILTDKTRLKALEQMAARRGKSYTGPASGITAREEIVVNQLTVFATLRSAGFPITWEQAKATAIDEFHAVSETAQDRKLLEEVGDGEDVDDDSADPQQASTGSVSAVDANNAEPGEESDAQLPGLQ